MASIEKRTNSQGQTVYRVRIRRKGARDVSQTFKRLTDARRFATQTEADIAQGKFSRAKEGDKRTLSDAIDRYLASPIFVALAPGSQGPYRSALKYWRVQLGHRWLSSLTPAILIEQRDMMARRLKPATVNRNMDVLSAVFSIVVQQWDWLDDSPMSRVPHLTARNERLRILSDDELSRLLNACQSCDHPQLYPLVVLAVSTGARQMELVRLRWGDIDFRNEYITLTETKNHERRTVALKGRALQVMREQHKLRRVDVDWVFPARRGRQAPHFARYAWRQVVKQAQLHDFRFHDLRHTAASHLAMNGAQLQDIANVLGHKTLKQTMRYVHLIQDHTSEVVARMNRAVFGEL